MSRHFSPIFIVGSSRSGTTMMNRILGNHKSITALNELHYLGYEWDVSKPLVNIPTEKAKEFATRLIVHIRRGIWAEGVTDSERCATADLIAKRSDWTHRDIYQDVLLSEAKTSYITDQTPKNMFYISEIYEHFPHARIIHMIRDPRAVLFSQRNRWKKRWLGSPEMPLKNVFRVFFNYHPFTLSKLWEKSSLIVDKYRDADRYKLVKFEDLVENPEGEVQSICEYLGLSFCQSMMDVPQVGSSNKKHDQNKIGISSDVLDTWKNKLPKSDAYICESMLKQHMNKFGYTLVSNKNWKYYSINSVLRFPVHILGSLLLNPKVIYVRIKALLKLK